MLARCQEIRPPCRYTQIVLGPGTALRRHWPTCLPPPLPLPNGGRFLLSHRVNNAIASKSSNATCHGTTAPLSGGTALFSFAEISCIPLLLPPNLLPHPPPSLQVQMGGISPSNASEEAALLLGIHIPAVPQARLLFP